ncbi:MAG: protein kinase [Planctomycetota bacterium]
MQAAIGPYRVTGELARGGMGVIYRALDPQAGREVAIKVLHAGGRAPSAQRRRFAREAEALARVQHHNVVRVHAVGEHQGAPYLVMDLVEGESLEDRLEDQGGAGLDPRLAASIAAKLAGALDNAHRQGVVHRDVKPANVLLQGDEPLLTDFGLARDLEEETRLTQTGRFMGTPGYWAPEQARGERDVGPTADVFGLGATLYAMLTGQAPYTGETLIEVVLRMQAGPPDPPSRLRPELSRELEAICLRCLEADPAERYPSALELAADLRRFLGGEAVLARSSTVAGRAWSFARRRASLLGTLGALVGLGAFGLAAPWLARRPLPPPELVAPSPSAAARPDPAVALERARVCLRGHRYADGLAALEQVPDAPPELAWELAQGLARACLRADRAREATPALSRPAVVAALARGDQALRARRLLRALEALSSAARLHPDAMQAPDAQVLRQVVDDLELAGALLAPDQTVPAVGLEPFLALAHRLSLDDPARDLLYIAIARELLRLSPTSELIDRVATLGMRSLPAETGAAFLPVVQRLQALRPSSAHRYLLCANLLRFGDAAEGLALSEAVLRDPELSAAARAELCSRRAAVFRERGEWKRVIEERRRALTLAPGDAVERIELAFSLAEDGREQEAVAELQSVLAGVAWEDGTTGLLEDYRVFRLAACQLYHCGGRVRAPDLTRRALRALVEDGRDLEHPELWAIRAADLELGAGELEPARRLLLAAAPALERRHRDLGLAAREAAALPPKEARKRLVKLQQRWVELVRPGAAAAAQRR